MPDSIEINLDVAKVMNVKVKQGHSWGFTLTYNENGEPVPLTGTRKMVVSDGITTYTFAPGSGLVQAGNAFTVSRTVTQNTLHPGYYTHEIRQDEGTASIPEYKGEFIVEPSTALPT